jgi:single-stranded-DNA-specific exonuclease
MPDAALLAPATATSSAGSPLRAAAGPPLAAPGHPEAQPAPAPGRPEARLEIPAYDLSAALALQHELGVSHVVAQILVRRGLARGDKARAFLAASEAHEPGEFAGLPRAVALIGDHVTRGSRITVHGDYDVDGVCATAIMVRALRGLGATVDWFLPSRVEDGYGLASATIPRLARRGTGLLLTVDCGITAVEEVAAARAAGLEVVITDHHAPRADGELPDCPIVHPVLGDYPCPHLCGTAVAFKVAQALGAGTVAEDIELVALATVADLVPLTGENRRLVREGLRALANTAKPGLRALMAVSRVDPSALDSNALGFRLAPRINAAGRLRRPDAGLELLLTDDRARADEIAAELDAINGERRAVEQRIVWQAEAQVSELGQRSAYVLAAEDGHPGVIGIVASRIAEQHHRPAILIALDGAFGTGSGRSIPGFDLLGALQAGGEHLERYGGHRAAAGLTIRRELVDRFRDAVEHHAGELLTPELLARREQVDAIVSGVELGMPLAEELTALEPCGLGNPAPRLLIPGARFGDLRRMGEGRHARFSVSSGGVRANAVAFGCEGRLKADPTQPLDATFKLARNVYNGTVSPQLVLRHSQPCRPAAIEVLGEPQDFLPALLRELDDPLAGRPRIPPMAPTPGRTMLDRRGESPLAVLADACAAGGVLADGCAAAGVLAVCADVPRRLAGLQSRVGGFALVSYRALAREPARASRFAALVALDPPADRASAQLLSAGLGFTHWAWGEAELRFAQQMHELEYGLRTSLVTLYRGLRLRQRVTGEELEQLLRGDGPHGRSVGLAARLVTVLAELELVSLDRDLPALAIAGAAPTALERSPSFRVYAQRYEDGQRYLSSANPGVSV